MGVRVKKQRELHYTELRLTGGVPLFVQPLLAKKIIAGLKWSCENRGLRIYDYAILPDRIVMIVNSAWGSVTEVLESYKSFASKAVLLMLVSGKIGMQGSWMLNGLKQNGTRGNTEDIQIWENELFIQSLYRPEEIDEYSEKIKKRAVNLNLVDKPDHYLYCSAHPKNPLDGWIVEATDPWS